MRAFSSAYVIEHPSRKLSGIELYNGPVVTQNTGAGNGWASVSFALPGTLTPGQIYYARWFIEDPSAPGGYSMTPTMAFTIFSPSTPVAPAPSVQMATTAVSANRSGRR